MSNYQLKTRQLPLPPELVNVADDNLKKSITGRIRAPFDGIDKLNITLDNNGESEKLYVDDDWLKKERKRIEDEFTYQINNFGRVILSSDRVAFDKATARFKLIVEKYQTALGDALKQSQSAFEQSIIDEFSSGWEQKPPHLFARWNIEPTRENIRNELQRMAQEMFEKAISFDEPKVRILYKNVAPENIRESAFLDVLKTIMVKRRVPREIIESLFESGQVAPETGAFLSR